MKVITEEDMQLAADLEQKASAYTQALVKLLNHASDKLNVAYHLIELLGVKTDTTWDYIQQLSLEERKALLPVMLEAAGTWNYPCMGRAREQIRRLPEDWLLANLEAAIEPLLKADPKEAYPLMIELYSDLDFPTAIEWAKQGSSHENDWLRNLAQRWLNEHEK